MEILNKPEIKEIKERNVACVSFVGNYLGNTKVFDDLFTKLLGWAGPQQLMGPDTILMSAYYDDPSVTPPEELKLDVCMTLKMMLKLKGK